MKKVCLVNGSPRGQKSSSMEFLKDIERSLSDQECEESVISVRAGLRGGYPEEVLERLAAADAIVLVFPLYNYGLPGALMRLLEDYYLFTRTGNGTPKAARVYAVVNCGFPRPEITEEAIRVVKNFCRRLSLNWRFAVRIGTGPVVVATRKAPFLYSTLKRAWADLASDVRTDAEAVRADYLVKPVIPEPIIHMIKSYYEWKGQMIQRDRKPVSTGLHYMASRSESGPAL
jgi:hypothetical protein